MGVCRRCGSSNRDAARFCVSCGAALVAPCPSCGAQPARPDDRFCDECGTPLSSASSSGGGGQARKVVTILFADLAGSTAAEEAMDPESVRRWLDRYYAVVRREVEANEGRVVKFIGDGVMAVFGVPEVREDDAERALAAGLDLHRAFADLADSLHPGTTIGLRVGINTGEVVVSAADDDVVGDAVNVAARLEQAARPGEVLVGEATYRLVRTRARLRAVPPLTLKGKAEPVSAFALQSLESAVGDAASTPFVGRAGELQRLLALLDESIAERRPQLASLIGVPGVGKSRLVHELTVAAADRARAVVVRCDPAGGATFAPVAAALRDAASLEEDASDETIVAGLAALFDEDEVDRQRIAETAASILGVGEPGLPEEVFWAVRRLIENAGRRRPLLFVFEDVHWAEPLLLDLVENLVAFARDTPAVVVVTARPELRELRPSLVEVGGQVRAAIHVEGLQVDESRRLAQALLDGAALPPELLDRVTAASEGNPLFVRELVRMLVDDGVLHRTDRGWAATVDLRRVDVPLSIHAVLAARIDRLAPAEQEVIGAAAVLGRTFARGAVHDLVGEDTAAHLDDHLEGLRRKELVERTGTYWLDEPQLRFHHALVQDAAYRRLLKQDRARLHARAATWLAGKVGDQVEHDDLIGYQLEQAHLLRQESGDADAELGREAAARLRSAGRRALEADDRRNAAALLGRAAACLPVMDPGRADLLIDRCDALLAMGDVTAATPVVAELGRAVGEDRRLAAWAACFEGELDTLRDPGHLADTVERAAAAATALDALGDTAGVAKAHAVRAASLARLGQMGECERALDDALIAARAAGDRRRATAILAGAPVAALWGPNPVTRASGRCLDVVRVLRITSRAPAVEATSLRCQAVLEALRGRFDAARRMLESARAQLEDLGHALGLVEVDLAAGMVETLADDLDAASPHLERALLGFHELGIGVDAGLAAALLARVRRRQGDLADALELTRDSERLGGEDLRTAIAWRSVRAAVLASDGSIDEARRLAEDAVALAAGTDALIDHGDALLALADVRLQAGEPDAAEAMAAQAVELYARKEATILVERGNALAGGRTAPAASGPDATAEVPADDVSALGEVNRAVASARPCAERVIAADWDGLAALIAPGGRLIDRRPLVGSDGEIDFVEISRGIRAVGVNRIDQAVLGVRGRDLALLRVDWRNDANDTYVTTLNVWETRADGLLVANVVFEEDQEAEAWAELERRHQVLQQQSADAHPHRRTAALSQFLRLAAAVARDFDEQEIASCFTPSAQIVDRRPLVGDPDGRDPVEMMRAIKSIGVVEMTFERVLGLRGDRLVLFEGGFRVADAAYPLTLLQLREVAEDGRISYTSIYEPAQLADAWDEMEDRFAASLTPDEAAVWGPCRRLIGLLPLDGSEDVGALLTPDFRLEDHRTIGWGTLGPEDFPELYRSSAELAPDTWYGFTDVPRITDAGVVARGELYGTTTQGSQFDGAVAIALLVEGGLVAEVHYFPIEELERAHALLDAVAPRSVEGEPGAGIENGASRVYERAYRAMLAGDARAAAGCISEDMVMTDHRALLGGHVARGRDETMEWLRSIPAAGFDQADLQVLAVRGDRLAMMRTMRRTGSAAVTTINVLETDDRSLGLGFENFDESQLDEATAFLDDRFADQLPEEHRAAWAAVRRVVAGANSRDLATMRAAIGDDGGLVDHRPLSWGTLDADGWAATFASTWAAAADARYTIPSVLATCGAGVLFDLLVRGTREGGPFEVPILCVAQLTPAGGVRLTTYVPEDRAEADAVYAGLLEPNAAVRCIRESTDLLLAGKLAEVAERYAPDIVMVDHRPIIGGLRLEGRDAFEPTANAIHQWEFVRWTHHIVATHGDRLALVHATFGNADAEVEVLLLAEVDDADRYQRLDVFDADDIEQARSTFRHRTAGMT